jgi:hypothetical protein
MAQAETGGDVEVLERGNVYFFYRPSARTGAPQSLVDVQRFHIVLSPEGRDLFRVLTVGKKRLPEPADDAEKFWGYVERVAEDPAVIEEELGPGREERGGSSGGGGIVRSPARPAGEGVYAVARHGNHTHLLYALELPEEPDEVQRELHIDKEGVFLLSIKNPAADSPPGVGLEAEQKADFPPELQERFGSRRFLPAVPPEFLDYEGAELLLMGSAEDHELDIGLDPERETEETADIFKELKLAREGHPVEPLLAGKWA